MRYPEKYPDGFMRVAVDELKTKEERAEAIQAGSQHFLTMIEEALNGFITADAPMVLVALQVYSDSIKRNEAGAAALAALILDSFQVERVATYLPRIDK